jgi:hypothetical protein
MEAYLRRTRGRPQCGRPSPAPLGARQNPSAENPRKRHGSEQVADHNGHQGCPDTHADPSFCSKWTLLGVTTFRPIAAPCDTRPLRISPEQCHLRRLQSVWRASGCPVQGLGSWPAYWLANRSLLRCRTSRLDATRVLSSRTTEPAAE